MLHKYADSLYNKNIPRTLQPIAQKRVAVYIKPLGELGDLPPSAEQLIQFSIQGINFRLPHRLISKTLINFFLDNLRTKNI